MNSLTKLVSLKDGFVFQLGAGGAPLTVAKFIGEKLRKRGEVAGFAIGGATGILTGMLEEGLIRAIYDTQHLILLQQHLWIKTLHISKCPLPCTLTLGQTVLLTT